MTTALAPWGDRPLATPPLLDALRRGDRRGIVAAALEGCEPTAALQRLAEIAIEQRRESISVLGNHEAFVRRTSRGSLMQVVQAVKLSVHDKTLYQVPVRRKVDVQTGEIIYGPDRGQQYEWRDVEKHIARVTYEGLNRLNAVAGVNVGQPPTVVVDGERRTNPYVEHATVDGERMVRRVVVAAVAVGHSPGTGGITTVSYTLDYEPGKELLNGLHTLVDKAYGYKDDSKPTDTGVRLVPARIGRKLEQDDQNYSLIYIPAHHGAGYVADIGRKAVAKVWGDYTNIQQHAVKKAISVARRNAMRAHPALAYSTVNVDEHGNARVRVIGWAGDDETSRQWESISARLARGMDVPELEELEVVSDVHVVEEAYDPAHDDEAEPLVRPADEDAPEARPEKPRPVDDPLALMRTQIDDGLDLLSDAQRGVIAATTYPDTEVGLRAKLGQINALLDS